MKKRNNLLKLSMAVALVFGSVGALAGCKKNNETAKTDQEKVYELYVAYMSATGETPQTYEQWLATIKGEKGETGATGAIGPTGPQGPTGLTGNGISDVDVIYEYDDEGNLWVVFTINYTEGDPQVIKTIIPKKITQLNYITLGENSSALSTFAKLSSNDDAPQLYMDVTFDDYTSGYIKVTSDMFEGNGIDFTTAGEQHYSISYFGQQLNNYIEIVDLADFENETPANIYLYNQYIKSTENLNNIVVTITYGDLHNDPGNSKYITAPLSMVADRYISNLSGVDSETIDITKTDEYTITLKDQFAYTNEGGYEKTLDLCVYNPAETTIQYISANSIIIPHKSSNYEELIKNGEVTVQLYEENEEGQSSLNLLIKDLNYDLSNFDVNRVGKHAIPISYKLEGQTKAYESVLWVSVEADLSEAEVIDSYVVDPAEAETTMKMFSMMYYGNLKLYDNGVATSEYGYPGSGMETQYSYELIDEGQTLKIYDSIMNGYAYYSLDTTNNYIKFYTSTGTPTEYNLTMKIMDNTFNAKISIYGTEGNCKGMVSIFMTEQDIGGQEDRYLPYSFVDCTWIDEDTISSIGRTFNVTTDNVLVEVAE